MKRRKFLEGVSSVLAFLGWPRLASAGFGIFQVGRSGGGGGSITLQAPDGGLTYYASNGFTVATAFPTAITWPAPQSATVNYVNGWDDPHFFPVGNSLTVIFNGTDASTYLSWGWNTKFYCNSDTSLSSIFSAGISMFQGEDDMHLILAKNGGSLNAAIIGLAMADESQNQSTALSLPISGFGPSTVGGDPTGADGSPGGNPSSAPYVSGVTASGNNVLHFPNLYSSLTATHGGTDKFLFAGLTVRNLTNPSSLASNTTVVSSNPTDVTISPAAVSSVGIALNTNGTTTFPSTVLHFPASVPAGVVAGMGVYDATTPTAMTGVPHVVSTTSTTVTIDQAPDNGGPGVGNGDQIVFGDRIAFGGFMTDAMQSGRPWGMGVQGYSFQVSQVLGSGSFVPFTQTFNTPAGHARRPHDNFWMDQYTMTNARRPEKSGYLLANLLNGTFSSTTPVSMRDMARGPNQGVMADYMRIYCGVGNSRPVYPVLELGNGNTNIAYKVSNPETNWQAWSVIIHGARGIFIFDYSDTWPGTGSAAFAGSANVGILANAWESANQSVTFTGQISGNVLTVTGITNATMVNGAFLQPGMEITTINGVAQSPCPVIMAQTAFNNEATFTGTLSNNFTLVVTGVGGTPGIIPLPSQLNAGSVTTGGGTTDITLVGQASGTPNGAGTYNISRGGGTAGPTAGWGVYSPGMNGIYFVSGGVAASPVTMVAKMPDTIVFGYNAAGTNSGTGNTTKQVVATSNRIRDLAPVINSNFALNFVLPSSTNVRYVYPTKGDGTAVVKDGLGGTGGPSGGGPGATWFLSSGIDCCVHNYAGSSYTSFISGETISAGYYIIATTAYPEDTAPGTISCTFVLNGGPWTTATVIGEAVGGGPGSGRTISIVGNTFSDTFQYPWTVHVYKIQ